MSSAAVRGFMAATRRQVSTARNMARACEPHPYQRVTMTDTAAPAYGKLVKNAASRVVFFGPAMFLVLGWPWISAKMLNGHIR